MGTARSFDCPPLGMSHGRLPPDRLVDRLGTAGCGGASITKKIDSLGVVAGRRLWEIENVVGEPKSWTAIGENRFRYCWHAQKYDVTLVFSGEICEGISNETWV